MKRHFAPVPGEGAANQERLYIVHFLNSSFITGAPLRRGALVSSRPASDVAGSATLRSLSPRRPPSNTRYIIHVGT